MSSTLHEIRRVLKAVSKGWFAANVLGMASEEETK
jgi:hypothetical protein